ncbi:MAG: shikimate kinase, partial [Acidimicrobiia bacterium]|nr:shikimate kinase [Acidimicrobiia bacterium]
MLAGLLASDEPLVVGAGGGAVLVERNRHLLRDGAEVVWLDAPITVLAQRVGSGEGRPLLRGCDPFTRLKDLLTER